MRRVQVLRSSNRSGQRIAEWLGGSLTGGEYALLQPILGLFLLTAAMLKGYSLATGSVPGHGLLASRELQIALVEFELGFGLWMMAGLHPRTTWRVALLLFGGFSLVSLSKGMAGEASCGCFGRVAVSPWWILAIDLTVVAGLLVCRPAGGGRSVRLTGRAAARLKPATVLLLAAIVGIPSAVPMATSRPAVLAADGLIVGEGRLVVIEPEKWIGKRLPLLPYIDIGEQLQRGTWRVILYHHACPVCRRLMSRLAGQIAGIRVACIEVPTHTKRATLSIVNKCVYGRLLNSQDWLVRTPVDMILIDGTVVRVHVGEHVADA